MGTPFSSTPVLLAVASGALTIAIGVGVRLLTAITRATADEALSPDRVPPPPATAAPAAEKIAPATILRRDASRTTLLDTLLATRTQFGRLYSWLDTVHPTWSAGTVVLAMLLGAAVAAVVGLSLGFSTALLAVPIGAALPVLQGQRARAARRSGIEAQLPDAIDMLVNGLRAGYSLNAAIRFAGQELPAPLGPEFTRHFDEQQMGIEPRQALLALQERLDTLDARMFVLALLIQRETGGNLSEVLGNVSRVVRQRIEFRQQVGVMTAESRASALILAGLPVCIFALLQVISPDYVATLTATRTGVTMLVYGALSITVGFVLLRRIAHVDM
jgi:tight adherence protein B